MTNPLSSGVKTSEFWLALLTPLLAVYGVLSVQFDWSVSSDQIANYLPFVASLASAIASHGFSASRAAVKSAALFAEPAIAPKSDMY